MDSTRWSGVRPSAWFGNRSTTVFPILISLHAAPERPPPKYRHKSTNRGYVVIDGRSIYLGTSGTAESRQLYCRAVAEWEATGRTTAPVAARPRPAANERLVQHLTRETTRTFERSFARRAQRLRKASTEEALSAFLHDEVVRTKQALVSRVDEALMRLDYRSLQKCRLRYMLARLTQFIEVKAYDETAVTKRLSDYMSNEHETRGPPRHASQLRVAPVGVQGCRHSVPSSGTRRRARHGAGSRGEFTLDGPPHHSFDATHFGS